MSRGLKTQVKTTASEVPGHLRDADDDHYQILVTEGNTMYRIAVNVEWS